MSIDWSNCTYQWHLWEDDEHLLPVFELVGEILREREFISNPGTGHGQFWFDIDNNGIQFELNARLYKIVLFINADTGFVRIRKWVGPPHDTFRHKTTAFTDVTNNIADPNISQWLKENIPSIY